MFNNRMGANMDVASWLRSLGLEKYEAAFRDNEITEKVLPRLTAEDLKEFGRLRRRASPCVARRNC